MSLKNLGGILSCLGQSWFVVLVLVAFLFIGCGSSEESTMEEPRIQEAKPLGTNDNQQPKEEKPDDQALTSFVGSDVEKPVEAPKPAAASPSQLAQYEKQIEDLRTENNGLKQKIVKLEQENRGINGRMSEFEAKYNAEKLRADRAEELAKSGAVAVVTPKAIEEPSKPVAGAEAKLVAAEAKPLPASLSAYEDALKAFNSKKYDDAANSFKAIVAGGANDDLSNRATYWLGETYYAKKKYKEALPLFQEAMKFKNSEKKGDAQFMIAQTFERLGNKVKAKEAYENVVKNYPMSRNVKRAKERWAKL